MKRKYNKTKTNTNKTRRHKKTIRHKNKSRRYKRNKS